jgi:RNA polymerase sigma factor (sigma-70 family)
MAVGSSNPDLAKDVQALFSVGVVANLSDGRLLERFASGPDGDRAAEAAFTELVRRHGPMVHRVCRNILNDPHDAHDATQATFLVLVRKAGSIRSRDSIAGWLHGTALRVARHARADAARRRLHERSGAVSEVVEPDPSGQEGWPELHEELARLPEKYRVPLVLCYLQGMTTEVAARQLGCPQGTILCRLSRGRERLRNRLIRRGLTASAALLALKQSPEVSGALTAGLATATARAALQFTTGSSAATASGMVSARGLALARDVLRTILMTKIKLLSAVVLAGTAIAVAAPSFSTTQAQQSPLPETRPEAKVAKKVDNRWVKKLPSGAVVELVGISTHPTGPKTWWSPDGARLSESPYASGGGELFPSANQQAREFAVRLKDGPDRQAEPVPVPIQTPTPTVRLKDGSDRQAESTWKIQPSGSSGSGSPRDQAGRQIPGMKMIAMTFPSDLVSCTVGFGLAAGPWKAEARCGPEGEAAMGLEKLGVIFGKSQEIRGRVAISVSFNALDQAVRIVAIDVNDNTHTAGRTTSLSAHDVAQQTLEFQLPLGSIKEFQFQTRPYEWAEFINVPLQPPAARQITP